MIRVTSLAATLAWLAGVCWGEPAPAGSDRQQEKQIAESSIEQLMEVEITSASKKEQRLEDAAASVFVITREMIRRSGLRSVPELLRLAPGVEVARVDASQWAIGIRGFNDPYGNKLLVLVDGRSVYNDIISGVYWSAQDMPVEEIERIEVVRGPVAAIWGANAVNGVINIITRPARESSGGTVVAGAGGDMAGYGNASYSARLGAKGAYRVYGGYRVHDALAGPAGNNEGTWIHRAGGFRMDWDLGVADSLHLEGQGFTGNARDVLDFLSPYAYNPGPLARGRLSTRAAAPAVNGDTRFPSGRQSPCGPFTTGTKKEKQTWTGRWR